MLVITGCPPSNASKKIVFTNTSSTNDVRFVLFNQHEPFPVTLLYVTLSDFILKPGESKTIDYTTPPQPGDTYVKIATANPTPGNPSATLPLTGVIPNTVFKSFLHVDFGKTCLYDGITVTVN